MLRMTRTLKLTYMTWILHINNIKPQFLQANSTNLMLISLQVGEKRYLQDSSIICPGSQSSIKIQSCRKFNCFLNKLFEQWSELPTNMFSGSWISKYFLTETKHLPINLDLSSLKISFELDIKRLRISIKHVMKLKLQSCTTSLQQWIVFW